MSSFTGTLMVEDTNVIWSICPDDVTIEVPIVKDTDPPCEAAGYHANEHDAFEVDAVVVSVSASQGDELTSSDLDFEFAFDCGCLCLDCDGCGLDVGCFDCGDCGDCFDCGFCGECFL